MNGQAMQDKLDAIANDLHTSFKGHGVNFMFRGSDNGAIEMTLASYEEGTVIASELLAVSNFIQPLIAMADDLETFSAPVQAALAAFQSAQGQHEALIEAARQARLVLQAALEADATYQAAKTALENARANGDYIDAVAAYRINNVSENSAELSNARGKYFPFVDGSSS